MEVEKANAMDTSIAMILCLGLLTPQSTGIGGGFFMTIYKKFAAAHWLTAF